MLVLLDMCAHGLPPNRKTHGIVDELPWSTPEEVYAAMPRPTVLRMDRASSDSAEDSMPSCSSVQVSPVTEISDCAGQEQSSVEAAAQESTGDDQPLSYRVLPSGDAIIDLHGLPVEVAKIAVQVALEDLILGGGPGSSRGGIHKLRDLIIITGVGNHSPGKIALVKPAVIAFLRDQLRLKVLQTRRDGPGRLRVPASELRRLCE